MDNLECKGTNYYVKGRKVKPILVGGPIQFSYEFPVDAEPDDILKESLENITAKATDKLAISNVPDAYLFRGLTVKEPRQKVADGFIPERNMRHGFILYFRTEEL